MTTDLGQAGYRGQVASQAVTVAQLLGAAGYRSFLSGKWHLGTPDPTRHGFEQFYGTLVSAKTFWDPDHFVRMPKGSEVAPGSTTPFYGTDALVDHSIHFLDMARQTPEQPWFLYLAFNAPHFPLHAPPEDVARYADWYHVGWDEIRQRRLERMQGLGIVADDAELSPRARYWDWGETESRRVPAWLELPEDRRGDLARRMAIYAAMVDRMDRNIGRLLADLRKHGEENNTLILFTSDNGACAEWDPFGFDIRSSRNNTLHWDDQLERMGGPGTFHSVGSGWANASNTPWRLYKHFNHEGGIASPAVLAGPIGGGGASVLQPGAISDLPMHIIDIMPTLLDAAGVDYELGTRELMPLPGISMLEGLGERAAEVRERTLFFEHQGNRAVRSGRWKLVALRGGPWELYDFHTDRTEQHDLSAAHPQRVAQLSRDWHEWADQNQVLPIPERYGVQYLPERFWLAD